MSELPVLPTHHWGSSQLYTGTLKLATPSLTKLETQRTQFGATTALERGRGPEKELQRKPYLSPSW